MSKPIRVLLMVENVPLGRDHRLRKHATALVSAGARVTVICRRDPGNRELAGVRVLDYPASDGESKLGFVKEYSWSLAAAAWLTLRTMLTRGVDVVQVSSTPDIYFLLAVPLKLLGRRVIFDFKDLSPEIYAARYDDTTGFMYRLLGFFERASLRTADHVMAVNHSVRGVALRRGGLPDDRVTVVGNGPLLSDTAMRTPKKSLKDGRDRLCVLTGMMGPQDGIDLAMQAIAHLVNDLGRTDTTFVFAGIGDAVADARRYAAEHGIDGYVGFPGWVTREEVYELLCTADVGLEPNLEEFVTPVKAMEYMAFGLPFVAFDVDETRIIAGEAAVLTPPGDVRAFARSLHELLADDDRRARMGAAGRRAVLESLAWDHQQVPYREVVERLAARLPERETINSGKGTPQ